MERFEKLPCIDFSTYEYTGLGVYTCQICGDSSTEYTEATISGERNVWTESWYRVYLPTEESEVRLRFYLQAPEQGEYIGEYVDDRGLVHDIFQVEFVFNNVDGSDKYVLGGAVDMTFGGEELDYLQFFLCDNRYTGSSDEISFWFDLFSEDTLLDVTLTGGAKLVRLVGKTNENVAP